MAAARPTADRIELEHDFLDHAKQFNWSEVKTMLTTTPDLVNVQPAMRWSALHQAAYDGNAEMATFLIEKGADVTLTTRADQTPSEIAKNDATRIALAVGEVAAADADAAAAEPPKKKPRKMPHYKMNVNSAVDKEYEGSSLGDIVLAPTSAIQGIAERGRTILKKFKVQTVGDLGAWKFYQIAKAVAGLAALEQAGKREEGAALNVNKAMDKKHETKSFAEMMALPPSALQGLAGWADADLAELGLTTIEKLGNWKYAQWAENIATLAKYENTDFSSL